MNMEDRLLVLKVKHRSTNGCSKFKVRNHDTLWSDYSLNTRANTSSKWDRTSCAEEEAPSFVMPHPLQVKTKVCYKVHFGNKVTKKCKACSMEGVTVYDHTPEFHVAIERGVTCIIMWILSITSLFTYCIKLEG